MQLRLRLSTASVVLPLLLFRRRRNRRSTRLRLVNDIGNALVVEASAVQISTGGPVYKESSGSTQSSSMPWWRRTVASKASNSATPLPVLAAVRY